MLQATLALLVEGDHTRLTIDAIAERSGVHKTTLYRRWGSVSELVKAAIASVDMGELMFEDTGSLASDILSLSLRFAEHFQDPEIMAINRLIVSNRRSDNLLAQWMDEYWAGRHKLYHRIVGRAMARGEVVNADRFPVAVEMIVGPMVLRTMMTGTAIDEELIQQLARSAFQFMTEPCMNE
ncbi:MAG: TetR/AcrR family transcriptional regulator [Halioglobus sp.]|nr:TetR/AcrR family transcriptional regulator [Halioglobus sp.]